jgi:hypothetical protein
MAKSIISARILTIVNLHTAGWEGTFQAPRHDQNGQAVEGYVVMNTVRTSFLSSTGLGNRNDYDYVVLHTSKHHINEPLRWNDGTPVFTDLAVPYHEGYLWHGKDYKSVIEMGEQDYSHLRKQINDVVVMEAFRRAEQR